MPATSAYCDYNAGAPIRPAAVAAATRAMESGGNPSSVHGVGRRARATIEAAREQVAVALGARPEDIVFASGATEALHLAMDGAAAGGAGPIIASAIEHAAIAERRPTTFAARADGQADLDALGEVLRRFTGRKPLVALMHANNETGAWQPVTQAAEAAHMAGGVLLCDAAQTLGRGQIDHGADYVVISSHKIGGPAGAAALWLRHRAPFASPRHGGGQERGRRPGTENLAAIAGFGAAAEAASAEGAAENKRLQALRDKFESQLRAAFPDVVIFAEKSARLPTTSLFALPGWPAETALIALDLSGCALSSGSACSSGKVQASRVLAAMGVAPSVARCALRASFGWASAAADVDHLLSAISSARGLKGAA